ncbi:hypothetical protein WICPIJ_004883 [Wickerhamomyces pijperi]|uniref:GPI transamidase component GAB1 n=1 Tax=Wickerhamomyces pijperi TaxID=599730 RepID=A0A9P8TLM8_WICPI|nr:hypothetical protein WICPIJ_004883 [Wickerhamomyces pijperi]
MHPIQLETVAIAATLFTRLAIPFLWPSVKTYLEDETVLFSTLITSHKSLEEGIFFYLNNFNIYDGGVVHTPPLLIYVIAEFFKDLQWLLWPLIDAIICYNIMSICKKFSRNTLQPWVIGLVYALNPIGVMENISKSWLAFHSLFVVLTFNSSLKQDWIATGLTLSLASYLNLQSIFLLIPLTKVSTLLNFTKIFLTFIMSSTALYFISYNIANKSNLFIYSTYIINLSFTKIAPNLGLWWYFFTEMFEFFIPFYNKVFLIYQVIFIIPTTLRLPYEFAFIVSVGLLKFGNSYAELSDLVLLSSLILTQSFIFPYLRIPFISILMLLMAIILAPIFYSLWINLGSGNSNFFYAITIVYNLGLANLITDFTWAVLEWEFKLDEKNKDVKKVGHF